MTSYPFINDLFTNVLQKSKAIEGRFYVSSNMAREINSDVLGQVLTDTVTQVPSKKYPLSLMMPPRSRADIKYNTNEFENYSITMFFLKGTYYDSNNHISNVNPNTQTSQHTILQDWHDMKRCASSFIRVLDALQRNGSGLVNYFRIDPSEKIFRPISATGVDRASGVQVDFAVSLFNECVLEDYNIGDISSITIPAADSHPEHKL